jgi:hypothetical protein
MALEAGIALFRVPLVGPMARGARAARMGRLLVQFCELGMTGPAIGLGLTLLILEMTGVAAH